MENIDFFISYNKKDKQWAKWVAGLLEENGYSTIIQAWDFHPGNNFIIKMQNATKRCKKTIIILSEDYLTSEYCQPEWAAVFNNDPTGEKRNLIPIRISDVEPEGLLSPVIYIDLFQETEENASKKILDGIEEKEIPRKKPLFPGKKNEESYPEFTNQEQKIDFVFQINEENKAEKLSIKMQNALREWFIDGCQTPFEIKIIDKRIDIIQKRISLINEKIHNEEELSIEEENQYTNYMKALKKCNLETNLKVYASEIFLKDRNFHSYLLLSNYMDIYEVLKTILNFDCFDRSANMNNPFYTYLDFIIYLSSDKKHYVYFVAPIETSKVVEIFGGSTASHIAGGDAADLGSQVLKEVAVYFYVFLAKEVLIRGNKELVENKKVLNLLNYHVGLH